VKNRGITFTATLLALACFTLLPKSRAVSPPPDGGYAGNNTAEGSSALRYKAAAFQQSAVTLHRVAAFCFTRATLTTL
jgi:hypothetical protein